MHRAIAICGRIFSCPDKFKHNFNIRFSIKNCFFHTTTPFEKIISYFARQFKRFLHSCILITPKACISSMRSIVYHQHEVLYIIKPQENTRWRVMRYKGGFPPLMIYAALRASMICQACGLDKKIREQCSRIFCHKRDKRCLNEVKTNKRCPASHQ